MIKIIKEGTRDIRECESCGCLFSFDSEDIKFNNLTEQKYVKCPQCNNKVILEWARKEFDVGGYIND